MSDEGAGSSLEVTHEQTVLLKAERDALWPFVSDTERLNREIGLPPVSYRYEGRGEGGARLLGDTTVAGIKTQFEEESYRWVAPSWWAVRRTFDNGPMRGYQVRVGLEPVGAQTRVRIALSITARGTVNLPFAHIGARNTVRRMIRACENFARFVSGETRTPYPNHGAFPHADMVRLQAATRRLAEMDVNPETTALLSAHAATAPPEDAAEMRPFALADAWGQDRTEVLRACLRAVEAGLLELRWRVLCPSCQGASPTVSGLSELTGQAHCPSCNLQFGPLFDRSVEVCFAVAPTIRASQPLAESTYCVGGPQRTRHVLVQTTIAPGETVRVSPNVPPGEYLLASPQADAVTVGLGNGEPNAPSEARILLQTADKRATFVLPPQDLPASGVWRWENRTTWPIVARLERVEGRPDVATAAFVTSLQDFRDRFGSEVLSPGAELAVRQITILFSDLKGSTEMYARLGDAPSYAAVRDHFSLVHGVVDHENGAILKTLGDAVMAAFPDPAGAVRSAIAIQKAASHQAEPMIVKMGLYNGPALAVNANGLLDYFGQTVNLAARVQALSVGGDVVIPASLADDASIASALVGCRREAFTAPLRGASGSHNLLRVWPDPSGNTL